MRPAGGSGPAATADNLRGVLWALAAVVTITVMFAILKHAAETLPAIVVAFMRTAVSFVVLLPWLLRSGLRAVATRRIGTHLLRTAFGISAFACTTYALAHLLLSDAMVLSFTSPFWTILISALVLGEVVRLRRTTATVFGFIGVVLIVRPQGEVHPAMIAALASALLGSCAMIMVKTLTTTEPATRVVFYFFLFGTLLLLPAALWSWRTPTAAELGWLVAAGGLGALGQIFLTRAYELAEVTVVAPYDFLRLPIAALIGYVVFAELPDLWSWVGTAVILGAALYIAQRERRLGQARTPA